MKKMRKVKKKEILKIVPLLFLLFIPLAFLILFIPLTFADYYSSDPYETDFEDIENPTAEDLQVVSDPTVDDFNRLSSYEQQQYLLIEYNTEFAAAYLSTTDFNEPEDMIIAEKYYSENSDHINDNPDGFAQYLNQEGIDITIDGPVKDYDETGNLYGLNQMFNLNNFKNSPASEDYKIIITEGGTITLTRKEGKKSRDEEESKNKANNVFSFNGNLQTDKTGKFSLKEGSINGYKVEGAKQLVFNDNGDISGGVVTYYYGITFAKPTPLVTENGGGTIHIEDTTVLSVAPNTDLYVYGSAKFPDRTAIQGKLTIPDEKYFIVDKMLFGATGDNVELRFHDDPSQDPYVTYAKIEDNAITLNGGAVNLLFNSEDYAAGTREALHGEDVVVSPNSGTVTISRENGRVSITGREMALQFKGELYTTEDGKLYKVVMKETQKGGTRVEKSAILDESLYLQLGSEAGTSAPIDIHVTEEGGVILSLENEYDALMGEEKPTIVGTSIEAAKLGIAYASGDVEGIQSRLDRISEQLEKGVGISQDDQEFLVALYSGISAGGYVKAGPNAGNALSHYFTGNGEQLDVDSEMFEESGSTQDAMTQMGEEIRKQQAAGQTEGRIYSGSCGCVHKQTAKEVNEEYVIDNTEGVITSEKKTDPELFYTNHNFYLAGEWKTSPDGKTEVVWSVDDLYDFKGFDAYEAINLPVLGTDEEIILLDGIAKAMATNLDIAKPFNVHAEWETTMRE